MFRFIHGSIYVYVSVCMEWNKRQQINLINSMYESVENDEEDDEERNPHIQDLFITHSESHTFSFFLSG